MNESSPGEYQFTLRTQYIIHFEPPGQCRVFSYPISRAQVVTRQTRHRSTHSQTTTSKQYIRKHGGTTREDSPGVHKVLDDWGRHKR